MAEVMSMVSVKGDELMVELMKLQNIAEQGLALELLQQLVNSVMSSYTLARFTVKAFVVQDSYKTNGKKKTLENIAEVLRFLVKREEKDDTQDSSQRNGAADAKLLNRFLNDSDEVNDLSVKDEVAQTIAAFSEEVSRNEKGENNADENDRVSEKDYDISEDDNDNAEDEDYKPAGRIKKDVKGAKKRKQGFKLRIRQSKKGAETEERNDEVGEEDSSNKDVQVKAKRIKKRKNRTENKLKMKDYTVSSSSNNKRRRQSDENVTYATNVHCFICEDERVLYPTEDDFFEHCLKEHVDHSEERKVLIPCSKCDKTFRVSTFRAGKSYMRTPVYTLLNHLVDKHGLMRPEWAPVYKCKNCPHTTLVRSFLPHHEKTCGQIVPTVTCEFCGMMLKKNSLYLHTKRCSNPGSKVAKYKCEECDKMYLTQAILDIHIKRMHRKEASHLCTQCTNTFFAKVDLERHMFVHHGVNISRMNVVSCPVCNFQTLEGSLMRKHMKNHEIGSHPCEFCGRIFGTMNRLRMHRLTHTAERKHKCPHCTYTAIRSFHLQRHIAVRHLGSPFKCTRCTFSTTSTNNLRRHMRKSHKCDELTAIEETSNIPTNSVADDLYHKGSQNRKRRVSEHVMHQVENTKLGITAVDEHLSLRQDELKEVPNVSGHPQLLLPAVSSSAGDSSELQQQQLRASQHHTDTPEQQLQQQHQRQQQPQASQQQLQQQHQRQQQPQASQQSVVVATASVEQAAGPSYIQPFLAPPYAVPYHMASVGAPVTIPAAANAEHSSFLRHVLGQKMAVVSGSIQHDQQQQQQQQQQQDPNTLYNIHYDAQQHQVPPSVLQDQQPQQQQSQQQSFAPQ